MIKILDKLISKSFIGPSLLSFFVAIFVLVMQFLWKYIDEILGKGFTVFDLIELIFYFSVTLIPMALPITVLISSVMVYGDMAEKYELSSFKSAGVSMVRLLLPGFMIALLIAGFSFLSSNVLKPNANFQFQKRLSTLRNQKTALAFEEGIFNRSFDDVLIKIDKVDRNGKNIGGISIFDHTSNDKSMVNIVKAKQGLMYTGQDGKYFVMELDTGMQYMEMERRTSGMGQVKNYPFLRTEFTKWEKLFDMSQFDIEDGVSQFSSRREELLNSLQLSTSIDSFNRGINENKEKLAVDIRKKIETVYLKHPEKKLPKTIDTTNVKRADSITKQKIIPSSSTKKNKSDILSSRKLSDKNIFKIKATKIRKSVDSILVRDKNNVIIQLKKDSTTHIYETIPEKLRSEILTNTISSLNQNRDRWISYGYAINDLEKSKNRYQLNFHQHFSWALICIIFLMIGAPMGSIIRKGGYGYPFLVAVLFYMIFIITTIFSTKMVKSGAMGGILAAWLPCIIQAPFGLLLSVIALRDVQIKDYFTRIIRVPSWWHIFGKKQHPV
ncbi:MAG: LptF/LptG family permease [Saprospiraceae bacterium]|nr:LptF/LptG family permease [Saprospiraceae bacterium]